MAKPEPFKWRKAKPTAPAPTPARPAPAPVQPAPATRGAVAPPVTKSEAIRPSHDQIAARAYGLWEAQGRPDGADRDHWFDAERQLSSID